MGGASDTVHVLGGTGSVVVSKAGLATIVIEDGTNTLSLQGASNSITLHAGTNTADVTGVLPAVGGTAAQIYGNVVADGDTTVASYPERAQHRGTSPSPSTPMALAAALRIPSPFSKTGDAQFTVSVNGQQVGGLHRYRVEHLRPEPSLHDPHGARLRRQQVAITFINDAMAARSARPEPVSRQRHGKRRDGFGQSDAAVARNRYVQLHWQQPGQSLDQRADAERLGRRL